MLIYACGALFAQIEVDNYIAADFKIKGVYTDGSTTMEYILDVPASTVNLTFPEQHPSDPNFVLDYFKVYTIDCTPTLVLDCIAGTSNVGDISECGRCGIGWTGEAIYTAGSYYIGLRCYQ